MKSPWFSTSLFLLVVVLQRSSSNPNPSEYTREADVTYNEVVYGSGYVEEMILADTHDEHFAGE